MNLRFVAVAALAAACGPSIKPAMQAATDQKIASYNQQLHFKAPKSYQPKEWKPGQWMAFRSTQNGKPPSVTVLKVLSHGPEGYWLETESQTYYGHDVTKALYTTMPRTASAAVDALVKVVTKKDDDPPQEIDFATNPMAGLLKSTMKSATGNITGPTDVSGAPKETVAVPAGTFEGAAKFNASFSFGPISKDVTGWFHPDVPLNGSVKSVTTDGEITTELLAFGDSGAQSAMP